MRTWAMAAMQADHYAEAQALFERAVAVRPTWAAPNPDGAGHLPGARRPGRQAEATLMRSYELDAGNPVTAYNLALLLYQRGDNERALLHRRLNNSESWPTRSRCGWASRSSTA
jgi:type IV pilus assembly protein PilF